MGRPRRSHDNDTRRQPAPPALPDRPAADPTSDPPSDPASTGHETVAAALTWALQQVGKRYRHRTVLDGVDLTLRAGEDTWRQWAFAWSATPGRHTLKVRATDAAGLVQTGERAPVDPDGATGWHSIEVTVQ